MATAIRALPAATPRTVTLRPVTRHQDIISRASIASMGAFGSKAAPRAAKTATPTVRASLSDLPAPAFDTVDVKEAHARLAAGMPILDVRTPAEFAGGHAPGAVNADVQSPDFVSAASAAFPDKDAPLLCSCLRGGRSAAACGKLAEAGYTNVVNVAGGWTAWTEAGLPEEK
jgi:rhodanese-related sulfurtransferase